MTLGPPSSMYKPTDVIPDTDNDTVFVVEQNWHRISKWNYTPGSFTFTLDSSWGSNGDGTTGVGGKAISDTDEKLFFPTGITINSDNDLLVTDTFNHRIRIIDKATGTTFDSFGEPGTGSGGEFYRPTGIESFPGSNRLIICDSFNHRNQVFTESDPFSFVQFLEAPSPIPLHTPYGVTLGEPDKCLISDRINSVINKYDLPTLTFEDQFGGPGTDVTQLYRPGSGHNFVNSGLMVDSFNNTTKFVDFEPFFQVTMDVGTELGALYHPASLASFIDTSTYLLVANTLNHRIEVFEVTTIPATFRTAFGSP